MNLIDNHVKGDECCPGMTLALSRVRPADKTGLMRSLSINMKKGTSSEPIILRINKSKKRSEEMANVSFIVVRFCPFCMHDFETERALEENRAKAKAKAKKKKK